MDCAACAEGNNNNNNNNNNNTAKRHIYVEYLNNHGTQDFNIIIMYTHSTNYLSYLCHNEIGVEWNTLQLNLILNIILLI